MTTTLVKKYEAHLDAKKRLVLRGTEYQHYQVRIYKDGHVELEPRVLIHPCAVSKRTLKTMDASMANFKKGKVSKPIDLSRY
ncbi:MAG: hypothetical protein SGI98_09415 [Verrucomicrobiota bacterium]|nr:hypothetical protein [Verrucomicrobiota bacterium]